MLIKPTKQQDIMDSFWTMMKECETNADNDEDRVLKIQVEGWYRQYNTVTGFDLKPRWMK